MNEKQKLLDSEDIAEQELELIQERWKKPEFYTKPVNALIDQIVFKDSQLEIVENKIRVMHEIREIKECTLEILSARICSIPEEGGWFITIRYRIAVEYISCWGFPHMVFKKYFLEKFIRFPLTCENDHGLIDFAKATPYLFIPKAECIDVCFENFENCAIIKTKSEIKLLVFATVKNDYMVLTEGCKPGKRD